MSRNWGEGVLFRVWARLCKYCGQKFSKYYNEVLDRVIRYIRADLDTLYLNDIRGDEIRETVTAAYDAVGTMLVADPSKFFSIPSVLPHWFIIDFVILLHF